MAKQEILDARFGDGFSVQGSVEQWNLHAQSARRVLAGAGTLQGSEDILLFQDPAANRPSAVLIFNATGRALQIGDAVGFADSVYDPKPDSGNHASMDFLRETALVVSVPFPGFFGVALTDTPDQAFGMAVVVGDARVRIHLKSKEEYDTADYAECNTDDPSYLIVDNDGGNAQIMWLEEPPCYPCNAWAIIRLPVGKGNGPSTSSTTTTVNPFVSPLANTDTYNGTCNGVCKLTWSLADQKWNITTSSCGPPSTTSSTSTSSTSSTSSTTSTSTTPNPHKCDRCTSSTTTANPATSSTSTTSSSSTSSSTTSSTTTPYPCQCIYPTWCGELDGDCTVVPCAQRAQGDPSPCSSTTSPNPCSTTTPNPDCDHGCDTCWTPYAGWQYINRQCCPGFECLPADGSEGSCAGHVGCTTSSLPEPVPCRGECQWAWVSSDCAVEGADGWWWFVSESCSGGLCGDQCICEPPTDNGTCRSQITTPCREKCQPPYDPCSTTTPNPCQTGKCVFRWDATGPRWVVVKYPCADECPCAVPPRDGIADCELYSTDCSSGTTTTSTTTTSTTTSTTTTSTTSTTTTPIPCQTMKCGWQCFGAIGWQQDGPLLSSDCVAPCIQCCPPLLPCDDPPGMWVGMHADTPCTPASSCPTTSTTTSTTTTPNPCSNGCIFQVQQCIISGDAGVPCWVLVSDPCVAPCSCDKRLLSSRPSDPIGTIRNVPCSK